MLLNAGKLSYLSGSSGSSVVVPQMQEYDASQIERTCQILQSSPAFCTDPRFQELIAGLLFDDVQRIRKRGIDQGQQTLWLMLPVSTCEALTSEPDRLEAAYPVAAAWELGSLAAGILDAWQDEDTEQALWREIGPQQAVNLAVGLIGLSFRTLSRLADTECLLAPVILALKREFEDTLLRMVEGQHLDLGDDLSLEDYQAVARAKTASLFRLACWAGAVVAGASPDVARPPGVAGQPGAAGQPNVAEQYGAFGEAVGLLIQAWNDLYSLEGTSGKRDVGHKRTLPILAALAMAGEGDRAPDEELVASAKGQGGRLYALVQVGLLHQRATAALEECPAAGRLVLYLDAYSIDHLVQMTE